MPFLLESFWPFIAAVPALMLAGGLAEAAWYRRRGGYPWREVRHSLVACLFASLWFALAGTALLPVYALLSRAAPWRIEVDGSLQWVALVLLVDLGYYWHHRIAHRVRWMWMLHAPHHSVKQLTLLNSLRFSWSEATVGWLFMNVPAVLLGFDPRVVPAVYVLIGAYQYWVHNSVVGRLGPLEWVLVTPAHHRVHHSTEAAHLDRNFGGLLVVFDRLFGTFTDEGRRMPAGYGLSGRRVETLADVFFAELRALREDLRRARGLRAKLRVAFGG